MNQKHTVSVPEYGLTFSTGSLAKFANGAVTVTSGETIVFVSATAATTLRPGQDFFPLTVDYREKYAAAGRFPGGYFKREGRPSEKEILTSRLCDRPCRPLFPEGFLNEVQIIGLLLSADQIHESDISMINGASAALSISDIPWNGPIAAVRLGQVDGQFVVNPTIEQMFSSTLDLIYVGTEKDMLMIEGSADQIAEERFVEALAFAHQAIQPIIKAIKELTALTGKKKAHFDLVAAKPASRTIIERVAGARISDAIFGKEKAVRSANVKALKEEAKAALTAELGEGNFADHEVSVVFEELQYKAYRRTVLERGVRADGRDATSLRPISCETGVLPACTAARSSSAVTPRDWSSSPSGRPRKPRTWTASPEAPPRSRSSSITTCLRLRWAKQADSSVPAAAKSATAPWPSVRSCRFFLRKSPSPTRFAWSLKSWVRTVPPPWPRSAAAVCR